MDNYAALVKLGNPDFIEIKGVTFCGDSKGINLSLFSPLFLFICYVPFYFKIVNLANSSNVYYYGTFRK